MATTTCPNKGPGPYEAEKYPCITKALHQWANEGHGDTYTFGHGETVTFFDRKDGGHPPTLCPNCMDQWSAKHAHAHTLMLSTDTQGFCVAAAMDEGQADEARRQANILQDRYLQGADAQ